MFNPACIFRRLAVASALVGAGDAVAADLIFPGIHPKMSAGAGQTVSRGSSALFYNPANLIFSKFIEPYLDVSLAQVTYTYQQFDTEKYDPVTVAVTAPPVTAGLSMRPIPNLAFGIALVPTGTGAEQSVKSVPLELTPGTYELSDIVTKQEGTKIAVGAAFRFGNPLTIGLGLIRSTEKNSVLVFHEAEDDAYVDALYGGASNQFIGGMRSELFDRQIVLALSYKTAVTKVYKGDVLIAVDENADYVAYEGQGFSPAAIGFGAEGRYGMFGVFFDLLMEQWSAGRALAKRGISQDPAEVDYVDAMNLVFGSKVWIAKKHMLQAGFGIYPANIGDGDEVSGTTTLQNDAEGDGRIGGVSFGNLDAIPRNVIALGYRYKLRGTGYLEGGVDYQTGSRDVPEGFNQAGSYSLTVLLVSAGIAFGF